MKDSLLGSIAPHAAHISYREMAAGLQKVLEQKYGRVLQAAGAEWDRRFAGKDPSDSCVRVRISAWDRGLSGLRRPTLSTFSSPTN